MAKMIRKNTIAAGIMIACMIVGIVSCNKDKDNFDASGSFEAIETIVSAEANGRIERLEIEEGQELEAGRNIGFIDSTQLFLKKKQLEAQIVAILGRKPDIPVQLSALQEQLRTAERERVRTEIGRAHV